MCGILGGNVKNWDYQKGIEALKHRGPDAQRIKEYPLCCLSFARLSIRDLSENAMQPMESADGNVVITFNGEIYGYDKLRSALSKKYELRTTSDTEVILYAYMEYGDAFIDKIDGMFAIVIYDRRTEMLKLYRDRYGVKPLYYYLSEQGLVFASELKAILAASGNRKWEIDGTALYDFLCYQYIPDPKSLYKDIYKLEPAHCMFYDLREKKRKAYKKYWKLHVNTNAFGIKKEKDVAGDIRELLHQSIQEQLCADVPVGTYLSGGIDSSIVTYECSTAKKDILAFTIGFHEKKADESAYAALLAKRYKINQKKRILSSNDIRETIGTLQEIYDEPFADTSAYPTYLVSKLARESVTVVLTGDGSDELFGGYERYSLCCKEWDTNKSCDPILSKIFQTLSWNGIKTRRISRNQIDGMLAVYCKWIGCFDEKIYIDWKEWLHIEKNYDPRWYLYKYYIKELPAMTRMRYLDFKTYLPGDILTKVDRASMRVSLEARVPFLNRRLVEYVFGLAEAECCSQNNLKAALKEAYINEIPHEIINRPKKGFSIPGNCIVKKPGYKSVYETVLNREWSGLVRQIRSDKRRESKRICEWQNNRGNGRYEKKFYNHH